MINIDCENKLKECLKNDSLNKEGESVYFIPYADRNKLILIFTELITKYDERVCSALL